MNSELSMFDDAAPQESAEVQAQYVPMDQFQEQQSRLEQMQSQYENLTTGLKSALGETPRQDPQVEATERYVRDIAAKVAQEEFSKTYEVQAQKQQLDQIAQEQGWQSGDVLRNYYQSLMTAAHQDPNAPAQLKQQIGQINSYYTSGNIKGAFDLAKQTFGDARQWRNQDMSASSPASTSFNPPPGSNYNQNPSVKFANQDDYMAAIWRGDPNAIKAHEAMKAAIDEGRQFQLPY